MDWLVFQEHKLVQCIPTCCYAYIRGVVYVLVQANMNVSHPKVRARHRESGTGAIAVSV